MTRKLFGTDGIRSIAGEFPLNSHGVVAIGRALGEKLGGRILIGQDTRVSSPWIFDFLRQGVSATSARIENAGVIPTPAVALLTQRHGYAGGVMISASHNPYEDNGIKVFAADGRKIQEAGEAEIERRVNELADASEGSLETDVVPQQSFNGTGRTSWAERYQELLRSHFPGGNWLEGRRIVTDCANGAMSNVAPELLRQLGAEVTVIHASPSGRNINAGCGALHMDSLLSAMSSHTADFGVAFDGDGDRSLFVSSSGRLLDGDAVLLMMARRLKRSGALNPPIVVGTLMTNYSLERMLRDEGVTLNRVAVGDRFVFEEMLQSGSALGGEPSGHIIFPDFRLSGDGLLTTLKVAEAIVSERASFDDLTRDWVQAPQLLKNVKVREKVPLEDLPAIQTKMTEVARELQSCGRLVVRYSGTEPLLRVMIESDDAARNERLMTDLLTIIGESLDR
jgi:phosphoglucosamine mutase